MVDDNALRLIKTKYKALSAFMDERTRRYWAATEAHALGWGGISALSKATGMSRTTIQTGILELQTAAISPHLVPSPPSIRQVGGGRKRLTEIEPGLRRDLNKLLESSTRGDPQSPLRWTAKSSRHLAEELERKGHSISYLSVVHLLEEMDYSLQGNRKTKEGAGHPDRDAQFEYINEKVMAFQKRGSPVVSIDAKKRELIGDFKQIGEQWRPRKTPTQVRVYDFEDPSLGHAIPYGVYDLTKNAGWVSVGIDHNTAEFAVESIRRWWLEMGSQIYPNAKELLLTADGGGSNGSRVRLWKVSLQRLADELGLTISICHFPPGTSKWNKIEHRMFCHITKNWRGEPLVSRAVVVNLIGKTTTTTGLRIKAKLDKNQYPTGIKVTDEEFAAVNLKKDNFHGEWNYSIVPTS
jgi:hypothetical protein